MRHSCETMRGTERISSMFEAATLLADKVSGPSTVPCVFLVASDRPLSIGLIEKSYPRCRVETSHVFDSHTTERFTEHGPYDASIRSDLQMLASAHHIVGSLKSTFSLVASELIAARRSQYNPMLVECGLTGECTDPINLVGSKWFNAMDAWPHVRRVFVTGGNGTNTSSVRKR